MARALGDPPAQGLGESTKNSGAKPTVSLTSSRFYARYRPLPRRSVISPPADVNRTPNTPSPQVPWYNMGLSEPSTTDKFATVPKFLLAMQSITFIIRHLQILLWSKMWDLDFGGAGGPGANDPYHNMEAHPPIPPPAAPVQYAHTPGVGDDSYVPPSAGPANPPAMTSPAASPYKPPASGPGPAQ